jgi:hypothetical protein
MFSAIYVESRGASKSVRAKQQGQSLLANQTRDLERRGNRGLVRPDPDDPPTLPTEFLAVT